MTSNISRNWLLPDGARGKLSVLDDGSLLSLQSTKPGTPVNARLEDPSVVVPYYFEIEIVELKRGTLSTGIVSPTEFLAGWKTRGMFYNGNLTNGSAALLTGFGEFPKQPGERIGVYVVQEPAADDEGSGNKLKVAYYLNGRCLGTGFEIERTTTESSSSSSSFYPCIHLDGQATLRFRFPSQLPTTMDREPATYPDAYSGQWLLKQALDGPELGEVPVPKDGVNIVATFHATTDDAAPSSYQLLVKVANSLRTNVQITGKDSDGAYDLIQVSPCMSTTRMMPPPALRAIESYVSKSFPALSKMIVSNNGGQLILSGPTCEMSWDRYEAKFKPLTHYK